VYSYQQPCRNISTDLVPFHFVKTSIKLNVTEIAGKVARVDMLANTDSIMLMGAY
jgi:hypothetical protein